MYVGGEHYLMKHLATLSCATFSPREASRKDKEYVGKFAIKKFFCMDLDFSVKAMSQFVLSALPLSCSLPFDRGVKLVGAQH